LTSRWLPLTPRGCESVLFPLKVSSEFLPKDPEDMLWELVLSVSFYFTYFWDKVLLCSTGWNSLSFCFSLPSTGITGMNHHTWFTISLSIVLVTLWSSCHIFPEGRRNTCRV
jgi:hypothetical protein